MTYDKHAVHVMWHTCVAHSHTNVTCYTHLKYPCGGIVCISQMVDSYILEFDNATLRIVAPGTNDYFDLSVLTFKKVWNNFEFELGLNNPYVN